VVNGSAQFAGGEGDGFGGGRWVGSVVMYQGATADGFSAMEVLGSNYLYQGGNLDGFVNTTLEQNNLSVYQGQNADGFSQLGLESADLKMYQGQVDDGFAFGNLYQKYIWSGAVGTGWNVDANWETNRPPGIRHQAIIPDGVLNFPFVNAGVLAIGANPNNGLFTCSELLIRQNAELTTRINCFIENYGKLEIRGTMNVLNTDANAFRNYSGSLLEIKSQGSLIIN